MYRRNEGSCVLAPSRVGAFGALGGWVERCRLATQRTDLKVEAAGC